MSAKTVAQRLSDDPETQAKLERSLTRLFDDEAELVLAKVEEFEEKAGAMPEGDVLLRLVNVIVDELLRARENGSWPDPESLCVDLSPPPFPAIYLPGPIATYVRALAEDLQVPLDLAGALTLAVFSAALQRRVCVQAAPNWYEGVALYVACVGRSGSGKTPAFSAVKGPFKRREERLREDTAEAILESQSEHRTLEAQLHDTERDLAKARNTGKQREIGTLSGRRKELVQALKNHRVQVEPVLVCEDVTPEKVAALLQEQGERLAIFSSEAEPISVALRYANDGRYNVDVYLKAWSGESHTQHRQKGSPVNLKRPSLVVAVTCQDTVLKSIAASETGLRSRGFLARFLWVVPRDMLGDRDMRPAAMEAGIRLGYEQILEAAMDLTFQATPNDAGEAILTLHPNARELFVQFQEWLEPQNREFGALGHMTDWTSKLRGYVIRLSGLLHCIEAACASSVDPCAAQIQPATMRAAINLANYFLAHARIAYREMAADTKLALSIRIDRWILESRRISFTAREVQRAFLSGQADEQGAVDAALATLEEAAHIAPRPAPKERGRGRPTKVYDVNPKLFAVHPAQAAEGSDSHA